MRTRRPPAQTPSALMSASRLVRIEHVRFPALASPDIAGVRAAVVDGVLVGVDGAPVPNDYLRYRLGQHRERHGSLEGRDGVIRLLEGSSLSDDRPRYAFVAHDLIDLPTSPYEVRLARLIERTRSTSTLRNVGCVRSVVIEDRGALDRYLSMAEREGCEGVVLRNPRARYYVGETPTQPFIASYLRFGE
jgi:hypothetical protein